MIQRFLIFLFLYMAGAVSSMAIGSGDYEMEKNLFQVAVDDNLSEGSNNGSFGELPGFSNDGQPGFVSGFSPKPSDPSCVCTLKMDGPATSDRIYQRQLFLLFHTFLFYDLK